MALPPKEREAGLFKTLFDHYSKVYENASTEEDKRTAVFAMLVFKLGQAFRTIKEKDNRSDPAQKFQEALKYNKLLGKHNVVLYRDMETFVQELINDFK